MTAGPDRHSCEIWHDDDCDCVLCEEWANENADALADLAVDRETISGG